MMDWYLLVLFVLIYFFGIGAILSYLSDSEYNGFANSDRALMLVSTFTWPISIWFIIGGAWMRRVIENGYIR